MGVFSCSACFLYTPTPSEHAKRPPLVSLHARRPFFHSRHIPSEHAKTPPLVSLHAQRPFFHSHHTPSEHAKTPPLVSLHAQRPFFHPSEHAKRPPLVSFMLDDLSSLLPARKDINIDVFACSATFLHIPAHCEHAKAPPLVSLHAQRPFFHPSEHAKRPPLVSLHAQRPFFHPSEHAKRPPLVSFHAQRPFFHPSEHAKRPPLVSLHARRPFFHPSEHARSRVKKGRRAYLSSLLPARKDINVDVFACSATFLHIPAHCEHVKAPPLVSFRARRQFLVHFLPFVCNEIQEFYPLPILPKPKHLAFHHHQSTMRPPPRSTRSKVVLSEDDYEDSEPVRPKPRKTKPPPPPPPSETLDDPAEAPLPPGAKRIPTKDDNLPALYEIPEHSQVRKPHGRIVMAVYDWRKPAMDRLFKYSANLKPPATHEEAVSRGEYWCFFSSCCKLRRIFRLLSPGPIG
jgi:hypothetical protein